MPITLPPTEAPKLLLAPRMGQNVLPLQGVTVLLVEDSRFASEMLRLMCQRSGARLRRADSLGAARAHLRVYRPDVVIVDIGLPDGSGTELIAELAGASGFDGVIIACSGMPEARAQALAAGAEGFLEKPIESLASFQALLRHRLSFEGPAPDPGPTPARLDPDPQALQDDFNVVVRLIAENSPTPRQFIADFVRGLARSIHDPALEGQARAAHQDATTIKALGAEVERRLRAAPNPFAARGAKA